MAVSVAPLGFASGLRIIRDVDADGTSENNLLNGAATLYQICANNSANGAASFVKLYNNAAPTVGTTAPDFIFKVAASSVRTLSIPSGITFATALSMACVTTGGTAGTTNPTSDVLVSLLVSE